MQITVSGHTIEISLVKVRDLPRFIAAVEPIARDLLEVAHQARRADLRNASIALRAAQADKAGGSSGCGRWAVIDVHHAQRRNPVAITP